MTAPSHIECLCFGTDEFRQVVSPYWKLTYKKALGALLMNTCIFYFDSVEVLFFDVSYISLN